MFAEVEVPASIDFLGNLKMEVLGLEIAYPIGLARFLSVSLGRCQNNAPHHSSKPEEDCRIVRG
jgi:hypothetical protein